MLQGAWHLIWKKTPLCWTSSSSKVSLTSVIVPSLHTDSSPSSNWASTVQPMYKRQWLRYGLNSGTPCSLRSVSCAIESGLPTDCEAATVLGPEPIGRLARLHGLSISGSRQQRASSCRVLAQNQSATPAQHSTAAGTSRPFHDGSGAHATLMTNARRILGSAAVMLPVSSIPESENFDFAPPAHVDLPKDAEG